MSEFVKAAKVGELQPGEMKLVEALPTPVLLVNYDGQYYAIDEICPHADGPLSEGFLDGKVVECPWHGSQFDVTTGAQVMGLAMGGLARYPVRIEGDDILVGPAGA